MSHHASALVPTEAARVVAARDMPETELSAASLEIKTKDSLVFQRRPCSPFHDDKFLYARSELTISTPLLPEPKKSIVLQIDPVIRKGNSMPVSPYCFEGDVELLSSEFGVSETDLPYYNCYTFALLPYVPVLTSRDWLHYEDSHYAKKTNPVEMILTTLFDHVGSIGHDRDFEKVKAKSGDILIFNRGVSFPIPVHAGRVLQEGDTYWVINKTGFGKIWKSPLCNVMSCYRTGSAVLYRFKDFST